MAFIIGFTLRWLLKGWILSKLAIVVRRKLIKKYNESGPRYTSYPPATFFTESYGNEDYIKSIEISNQEKPESVSVYIHVPFCPQICHFCLFIVCISEKVN